MSKYCRVIVKSSQVITELLPSYCKLLSSNGQVIGKELSKNCQIIDTLLPKYSLVNAQMRSTSIRVNAKVLPSNCQEIAKFLMGFSQSPDLKKVIHQIGLGVLEKKDRSKPINSFAQLAQPYSGSIE